MLTLYLVTTGIGIEQFSELSFLLWVCLRVHRKQVAVLRRPLKLHRSIPLSFWASATRRETWTTAQTQVRSHSPNVSTLLQHKHNDCCLSQMWFYLMTPLTSRPPIFLERRCGEKNHRRRRSWDHPCLHGGVSHKSVQCERRRKDLLSHNHSFRSLKNDYALTIGERLHWPISRSFTFLVTFYFVVNVA